MILHFQMECDSDTWTTVFRALKNELTNAYRSSDPDKHKLYIFKDTWLLHVPDKYNIKDLYNCMQKIMQNGKGRFLIMEFKADQPNVQGWVSENLISWLEEMKRIDSIIPPPRPEINIERTL